MTQMRLVQCDQKKQKHTNEFQEEIILPLLWRSVCVRACACALDMYHVSLSPINSSAHAVFICQYDFIRLKSLSFITLTDCLATVKLATDLLRTATY